MPAPVHTWFNMQIDEASVDAPDTRTKYHEKLTHTI
jgi:hypothetical protein